MSVTAAGELVGRMAELARIRAQADDRLEALIDVALVNGLPTRTIAQAAGLAQSNIVRRRHRASASPQAKEQPCS